MEFDDLIGPLLNREGGYVDDPDDRGGATSMGITQPVYDAWRRKHGMPTLSVKELERGEAAKLYFEVFWLPANCPALPSAVREIQFDAAINHGVDRANRLLQRAARCKPDGMIGPVTLRAVFDSPPELLVARYMVARYRFYGDIINRDRSQLKFIAGWMNRMAELDARASSTKGA